ncbi:hypothetical protein C0995_010654 [Termitomyces sp. Mi166|nr:hypothetical protein C0995_010654 [Termitomyces sp. Mi166\
MALNPEVMKKAQTEIDSVVGNDRLPTFEDRQYLPYVDALAKEVFRWNVVVPNGVAHRSIKDDVHDGYFIPKGTLVIANIRGLLHDPEVYPDPYQFKPERFIATGDKSGLHLADASVFISCAMSLAVFDISKSVENGVIIEPVHENTEGTISHPKPYKCSIKPRSEKAVSLIQAEGH